MGSEVWQIFASFILWVICALIAYKIVKKKTPEGESIKMVKVILITLGLRFLIGIILVTISLLTLVPIPTF
ncbi:hypothetical protein Pelsub_P1782 [Pelolinea submarina]|uniref:Uncharacterized protein n=1 Tax=Pelolinea submarina TaxID=913107 RepID=A0A347ZTC3_9CHLR|nr:hypothetical protein DFR64_0738 [Pelolinea submarina]BBB48554.1 hypothetical protein Pelsub_P1782 [Pelolinea submarina]